jgi:hypothetical protein
MQFPDHSALARVEHAAGFDEVVAGLESDGVLTGGTYVEGQPCGSVRAGPEGELLVERISHSATSGGTILNLGPLDTERSCG